MKRILQILVLLIPTLSACGITSDIVVSGDYRGKSHYINIQCHKQLFVKRADFSVDLDKEQIINGTKYYLSDKCIEVGKDELLSIPTEVEFFDIKKNKVDQNQGVFSPSNYSQEVLFASRNRGQYVCSHSKSYYASSQTITIPKGKGLILSTDCILLTNNNETIYHNGYYYSKDRRKERIRIACTQKKEVIVSLVPVVCLRKNTKLTNNSKISDCLVVCDELEIIADNNAIFENVILTGTIKNKEIKVEWFGCNIKNTPSENSWVLERYIIPSAITCKVDIFHSENGTYKVGHRYPLFNRQWGFDHSCIKDYQGITIRGNGNKTVIMGCDTPINNAGDVFNIVDSKNLTITDLSVKVQSETSPRRTGINAFSLIHNNENIMIERCYVHNMPYIEGATYPDGGKGFTIQCGPNTRQKDIRIMYNRAENVSYGLDYTKTRYSVGYDLESILFEGNTINKAIAGVVVHEWDSPYQDGINPIIVRNNTLSECQVGVVCQTTKACHIINNTITSTSRPQRLLYYPGVYGVLISGAYNTTIEGNTINIRDCDSFINIGVYSYYPRFNGSVRNVTVDGNTIKGNSKGKDILVGKARMTKEESKMFENVKLSNNILQ